MDFMNRGQQQTRAASAPVAEAMPPVHSKKNIEKSPVPGKWFRISWVVLLTSVAILLAALSVFFWASNDDSEQKFVTKDSYQAVFVNINGTAGGQVYFGHIKEMSNNHIQLSNVFYIQNQTQAKDKSQTYNLVKLGCELHGPQDTMIINRSQVFFWENLKSDSQVSTKIGQYYKENPGAQKCTDTNSSNSTQQGANNSTNSSGSSNTSNPTSSGQ